MAPAPLDRVSLGDVEVDLAERVVLAPGGRHPLSPLEVSLLRYLAERRGQTVARERLLTEVWSYSERAITRAVDNTVSRLRRKIELDPANPRWLVSTRGGGYRLEAPAPRSRLPAEPDGWIGREAELADLGALLGQVRLLTLVGPGGIGKTRLALRLVAERAQPAWFADLSAASDAAAVARAVAAALDVQLGSAEPLAQLGHVLAARGPTIGVLDNAEQVAPEVARAATAWLERAPELRLVVTSRERTGARGEAVSEVPPLAPDDGRALFLSRAAAASGGRLPAPAQDATIRALVAVLDGLPLAIELAAARTNLLSPSALLDRMNDRFAVLVAPGRWRPADDRHRTLAAAFDWSWDLLHPDEQEAMGRLTPFEGGFAPQDAEGTGTSLALLQSLCDKSLIRRDGERLTLLVSLREHARARTPADRRAEADARHGAWFARHGTDEAAAEIALRIELRRALVADLPNLVAACRSAAARGDADIAGRCARAAWKAIEFGGALAEGRDLLEAALAVPGMPRRLEVWLRLELAHACRVTGRPDAAQRDVELGLALAEVLGDPALSSHAWWHLGCIDVHLGRTGPAGEAFARALALARQAESPAHEAAAIGNLGLVHLICGELGEAAARLEDAWHRFRTLGNRRSEASTLSLLGSVRWEAGDYEGAARAQAQARELQRSMGDRRSEALTCTNLAISTTNLGRPEEAMALYDEAQRLSRELGSPHTAAAALGNQAVLLADLGHLTEAREALEEVLATVRTLGDRRVEGETLANLGEAFVREGALDRAEAALLQALDLLRAAGQRRMEALVLGSLGDLERRRGDRVRARARFDEGEAVFATLDHPAARAQLLLQRATLEHEAGDAEGAAVLLAEAERLAASTGSRPGSRLVAWIDRLRETVGGAGR